MSAVSVTSKGQVTIPVKVRRALGIESGTKVSFTAENGVAHIDFVDEADAESERQHEQVVKALSGKERFYVPKTVLLELEWVLRGFYDQARNDILRVFDHLIALPMVRVEDENVVTLAIDAYRSGLDFAHSLHHASAHGCERFWTFDNHGFARPAGRLKLRPVVMLPTR